MTRKKMLLTKICFEMQASIVATALVASICCNLIVQAADVPEKELPVIVINDDIPPVMTVIEEEVTIEEEETAADFTMKGEIQELEALTATPDEMALLVRVVMSEGGGVPIEGKRAICECILNRVASDDYPDTIADVINQPNQFWTGNNGEPNAECYQAVEASLDKHMFPNDMYWFQKGEPSYGYECYYDGYHHYSSKTQH